MRCCEDAPRRPDSPSPELSPNHHQSMRAMPAEVVEGESSEAAHKEPAHCQDLPANHIHRFPKRWDAPSLSLICAVAPQIEGRRRMPGMRSSVNTRTVRHSQAVKARALHTASSVAREWREARMPATVHCARENPSRVATSEQHCMLSPVTAIARNVLA
jgi:hypothetical protein